MITVDRLEISGFKTILAPLVLDFTRRAPGLYYIRGRNDAYPRLGRNGVGKTSLLDAFCWCLWARSSRGLRSTDIVPWARDVTTRVMLRFRADDQPHEVIRTANPNRVTLDGGTVSQERIEQVFGLPFDLFQRTRLLAQNEPLFYDLQPREQMALFADALDLDRWEARAKKAGEAARALESEQTRMQAQQEAGEAELARVVQSVGDLTSASERWEDDANARRAKIERELAADRAALEAAEVNHGRHNLAYDSAMTELQAQQASVDALIEEQRQVDRNRIEFTAAITQATRRVGELQSELASLDRARTCPTCGQPIRRENVAEHRRELRSRLQECEAVIAAGVPSKTSKLLARLERQIGAARGHLAEFERKANLAHDGMLALNRPIAEIGARIRQAERLLREWRDDNPYRGQLQAARARKAQLDRDLRQRSEALVETSRRAERTKFWATGFKDLRLHLIEEALQELELATNTALIEVGLDGWAVKYDIERETQAGTVDRGLTIAIQSPESQGMVRWKSWSGGETQRLRLVGAMAFGDMLLRRIGIDLPLVWVDEAFRGMSETGIRDLIDHLAERARGYGERIFLIDHAARESDRFAGVLSLVREPAGTRIEREGSR